MALLPIPKTTSSSAATPNKTIAINCGNTNTVYYTVPDGVYFDGDIVPSSNQYAQVTINGVEIFLNRGANNEQFFYRLTLNAGDTIGTAAAYSGWQIRGNEVAL